jgi:hypothetical protein
MLSYDQFKVYMDKYNAERANAPAGYDEAAVAMEAAKTAGLMDGQRPCSPLTRAEYAIIMKRKGDIK